MWYIIVMKNEINEKLKSKQAYKYDLVFDFIDESKKHNDDRNKGAYKAHMFGSLTYKNTALIRLDIESDHVYPFINILLKKAQL